MNDQTIAEMAYTEADRLNTEADRLQAEAIKIQAEADRLIEKITSGPPDLVYYQYTGRSDFFNYENSGDLCFHTPPQAEKAAINNGLITWRVIMVCEYVVKTGKV